MTHISFTVAQLFSGFGSWLTTVFGDFGAALSNASITLLFGLCQLLLPLLALLIVVRCGRSLLQGKIEQENWGSLVLADNVICPLIHWENLVGRARHCDVLLPYSTVSRHHAALIRNGEGVWMLHPLSAANGVLLNGNPVLVPTVLQPRDMIDFGGIAACFVPSTREQERLQAERRTRPGKVFSPTISLILLTLFQLILSFELAQTQPVEHHAAILSAFAVLCITMWVLYLVYRISRRSGFELETLAFFLSSLCIMVTSAAEPASLTKQLLCVILGLVAFLVLNFVLRSPALIQKLRPALAYCSVGLLVFNVLFGARIFGAKNWISIGPIQFQPSEFIKVVFILVGAVTLEQMFEKRNLIFTLVYAVICVGCLGLMSDFGAALIFFVAFLAITFLRSGDLASILFMVASAAFGVYLILQFKPYIARRFAIFGHAWSDPSNAGYQQTRTMSAIASGGLFGRGAGNGWLHNLGDAARTDLVFGVVSEELGLLIAVLAVSAIVLMALFAVWEAATARSSFYVIAACSTAMLLVVQTMLNVFGPTDILPLTGVTLPFVSCGGSSMISCWALLSFIKAADTRQNAALAVPLPKRRKANQPDDEPTSWDMIPPIRNFVSGTHSDSSSDTVIRRPVSDRDATVIRRPEPIDPPEQEHTVIRPAPTAQPAPDLERTVIRPAPTAQPAPDLERTVIRPVTTAQPAPDLERTVIRPATTAQPAPDLKRTVVHPAPEPEHTMIHAAPLGRAKPQPERAPNASAPEPPPMPAEPDFLSYSEDEPLHTDADNWQQYFQWFDDDNREDS